MIKKPPQPVRRYGLLRKVVVTSLRFIITTINQFIVYPGWVCVTICVQGLRLVDYSWYMRVEATLYKHLLDLVAYWGWAQGFRIYESGDNIQTVSSKRCLVLPNHQSTMDIPVLFAVFHDKREVTKNVMWVSDLELMFSHIGVVCLLHGDMFIRQKLGAAQREKTLLQVEKHLEKKFVGKKRRWCVVFPEGGFFRKRKVASQLYSEKKGYPVFERLAGPRVFGVEKIMSTVATADPKWPFEYIIDIIIAYQDQSRCVGLPDMLISGKYPENIHVHYSVIPCSSLKMDTTEHLEQSLFQIWAKKEKKLQNFYQFGYFDDPTEIQKVCVFSDLKCIALNLIYSCITLCCVWPGANAIGSFIKYLFAQ
ncbi:acyl-CoA:lysophosphatidylglycerol acyltransferase 1-like [Convolutriloba macropyga]|uniref:acyl-CoA:lysophosphatidylglycerol acyltransferase 1-like n=1 Tax=Convolutriloba macropyga TaxID=536237 RepID=UPI003F5258EE